jgi:hypothetical protein
MPRFASICQTPSVRCVGRHDTCQRYARPGSDLCGPCAAALRCARCGHPLGAHDEGPCAVNHHEAATGCECECEGWVSALDWQEGA